MIKRLGAAALLLAATTAWAVDWAAYPPQGYVSDFANVVDPGARERIENYCRALEQSTGAQLALVTIPSLQGEPVEDVARTLARSWGVGHKGANDGVLLLIAIGDRRTRLEVGSGLASMLPDDLDAAILREMRPALRRGDYGDALTAAAGTLGDAIAQAKHVTVTPAPPRRARPSLAERIPWPLVIGGVFILLSLVRFGAPRGYSGRSMGGILPWLILGNVLGRGDWGSRGSGGFGGYDSSDGGFGGFGGGDFGGGGASGDW